MCTRAVYSIDRANFDSQMAALRSKLPLLKLPHSIMVVNGLLEEFERDHKLLPPDNPNPRLVSIWDVLDYATLEELYWTIDRDMQKGYYTYLREIEQVID
jgi:hypothetical protein